MPKIPTVELHNAFFWICDDCGTDNFVRAIPVSRDKIEADIQELDEHDREILENVEFEWTMAPEEVVCGHCGSKFETEES